MLMYIGIYICVCVRACVCVCVCVCVSLSLSFSRYMLICVRFLGHKKKCVDCYVLILSKYFPTSTLTGKISMYKNAKQCVCVSVSVRTSMHV